MVARYAPINFFALFSLEEWCVRVRKCYHVWESNPSELSPMIHILLSIIFCNLIISASSDFFPMYMIVLFHSSLAVDHLYATMNCLHAAVNCLASTPLHISQEPKANYALTLFLFRCLLSLHRSVLYIHCHHNPKHFPHYHTILSFTPKSLIP